MKISIPCVVLSIMGERTTLGMGIVERGWEAISIYLRTEGAPGYLE
jgi:hypothetical protein